MARPSKKNPTGAQRKTKWTEETIQKLQKAFSIGASIPEACYFANISQSAYFENIKHDTKLKEHFDNLKQMPILKARQEVVNGLEGNPEFALKYLERKLKSEFSTRVETDMNITVKDIRDQYIEYLNEFGQVESKDINFLGDK